jgi:hypothetical protein
MKVLFTLGFALMVMLSFGQKKQLVEYKDAIVLRAVAELDSVSASPESDFRKEIQESNISGNYVFDITIREKGMVATVFVVNDGENPIDKQNRMKDIMKRYRFSFKVPKGKSYKFQYTFSF